MKALFLIDSPHETNLPTMNEIQYIDSNGVLQGGYWIGGESQVQDKVIICIHTTEEMVIEMSNNSKYTFLENVIEE